MRRGEVWELEGDRPLRGVIVSSDRNNGAGLPVHMLPIVRRTAPATGFLTVDTVDPDPVGGMILIPRVTQVSPGRLKSEMGMLTGATMARITDAMRDLYEL